jgi:hypothetical protein
MQAKYLVREVLLLAFCLLLFTGCRQKDNRPGKILLGERVVIDSQLTLPVTKRTNFLSFYSTTYREGEKEWLVRVNELTNAAQFYRDGKLDFELFYDYSGPHGIGQLMAVEVISMDSIIILPNFANRLYIGNSRGEVYKRYDFPPDKMIGGSYGFIVAMSPHPLIRHGNKLIVHTTQFYNYCDPRLYGPESSAVAEIDLSKGTIRNIVTYPAEAYGGKFWSGDHTYNVGTSYNRSKGIVYISFPASEYLYIYRIADGHLDKKLCRSERLKKIDYLSEYECKELYTPDSRGSIELLHFSKYGFCAFIPGRNLIYRFYHLPADEGMASEVDEDHDRPNVRMDAHQTGILIVDEEMNVLADVLLPKRTYSCWDYFVTEKGLWLSRHNFFRKDKNEDVMEFDLISYR